MDKAALRAALRTQMGRLSPAARQASDDALQARFLALPELDAAETVLLYYGVGTEPNTAALVPALLARGKRVALPRCLPNRGMEGRRVTAQTVLLRHPYGMLEPGEDCPLVPKHAIDLMITPGLAFDKKGGRLGQGGGYYDRYLAGFQGVTVALCRAQCLLAHVPTDLHDCPVGLVLTEGETMRVE